MNNRYQKYFEEKIGRTDEIRALQKEILKLQSAKHLFELESQDDETVLRLKEIFMRMMGQEPIPEALVPPPPVRKQLYERIQCGEILDLGSRDTKARSLVTPGVSVKLTDTMPKDPEVACLDANFVVTDKVTTSYLVLNQLDDTVNVEDTDGVHVVVDVDTMLACGAAEEAGGECVSMLVKAPRGDRVYRDRRVYIPGAHITYGYKMVNTYKERTIHVKRKKRTLFKQVYDRGLGEGDFVSGPASPKYDGEFATLVLNNGKGVYTTGNQAWVVECDMFSEAMYVYLERMAAVEGGCQEHFRLLRVNRYRNFIPYHAFENLNYFVKRVKIDIAGVPIYAPGDDTACKYCPTDGWIHRFDEMDYRVKDKTTFDFDPGEITRLKEWMDNKGLRLEIIGGAVGVVEYEYRSAENKLVKLRQRHDKEKSDSYRLLVEQFKL
jgi:hypothetical protein